MVEEKSGPGRKPVPEGTKKSDRVVVVCTPEQKTEIEDKAREEGRTASQWILGLVLKALKK